MGFRRFIFSQFYFSYDRRVPKRHPNSSEILQRQLQSAVRISSFYFFAFPD
jgi:hypothetical protein